MEWKSDDSVATCGRRDVKVNTTLSLPKIPFDSKDWEMRSFNSSMSVTLFMLGMRGVSAALISGMGDEVVEIDPPTEAAHIVPSTNSYLKFCIIVHSTYPHYLFLHFLPIFPLTFSTSTCHFLIMEKMAMTLFLTFFLLKKRNRG